MFDGASDGDVVFLDGSHRTSYTRATVFFLELPPRLAGGVLVGVDVVLLYDYPAEPADCHYSEQYLLAAHLQGRTRRSSPCCLPSTRVELLEPGCSSTRWSDRRLDAVEPGGKRLLARHRP